jgi:hypothetical protein
MATNFPTKLHKCFNLVDFKFAFIEVGRDERMR